MTARSVHISLFLLAFSFVSGFVLPYATARQNSEAQASGTHQADAVVLLDVADAFFASGNTYAGVTEAWRFLHAAPDHPLAFYAHYQIGKAEAELGDATQAMRSLQLAVRGAPNPDYRRALQYRMAVQLIRENQTDLARMELYQLALIRPDSLMAAKANVLIGLTAAFRHDFDNALIAFDDAARYQPGNAEFVASMQELTAYLGQGSTRRRKSPSFAKWSSTVLPGSGQVYAGEWLDGLFALSLNTGTTYLVVRALQMGSRRNAFLLIVNLWWRYYKGNRLNAEAGAINANLAHWEEVVGEVVNRVVEAGGHLPDVESGANSDFNYQAVRVAYMASLAAQD